MLTLRAICCVVIMSSLAGCGGRDAAQTPTVVVWHWMTDRDEAFQALAQQYTTDTGQAIRFELYAPSELYAQKIRGAIQTHTLPDIFGVLGETRDFASFVKSGYILDLTEAMRANGGVWEQRFFVKALDMNRFRPDNMHGVQAGIYGVPLDVMTIQMIYNKRLFQQAGLNPDVPPHTWEEFVHAGRALKAAGIPVLVSGFGETWLLGSLASDWAWNILGEEKVIQTYRGTVPYTDPDWVRVFDLFRELRDEGFIAQGAITMVNKRAEQLFANERAAFAFNGSWAVNVYHGMNPGLDYGVMLPPAVRADHPQVVWGGAGSSLMVSAASPHQEAAVAFLQWFTDDAQQRSLVTSTRNLPSNRQVIDDIPDELAGFAASVEYSIHPNVLPAQEYSIVKEVFERGLQSILIGEKTPEEVAADVQQRKVREMTRRGSQQRHPVNGQHVAATPHE